MLQTNANNLWSQTNANNLWSQINTENLKSLNNFKGFEWEAIISTISSIELSADMNGANNPVSNEQTSVAVRAIVGKKQGITLSSDPKKIKELILKAKKTALASEEITDIARISSNDEKFKQDINYGYFGEKELIESFEIIESSIDSKAPIIEFLSTKRLSDITYINSLGAKKTVLKDSLSSMIAIGKDHRTGFDSFSLSSKKPDYKKMAERALMQYDYSKNLAKPESGKYPVIFSQDALTSAMSPIFFSLKGENVLLKKSRFADSIGKKELSKEITLIDNPFEANNKSFFDSEGNNSKKTILIKKGVINSFIHDNFTSEKLRAKNTNNASSIMVKPSTSFNCLELKGNDKLKDMISDTKKGIMLYDMYPSHTINPTTGAFGQNSSSFYYIEKGEIKGLCKGYAVSGNSYELFKDILGVSRESRNDQGSKMGAVKAFAQILKN